MARPRPSRTASWCSCSRASGVSVSRRRICTEPEVERGAERAIAATGAVVAKAAEPTAYSEQITQLGLPEWRVKKVLTVMPADKQGVINLTPSQWASRLGQSPAEQAERLERGEQKRLVLLIRRGGAPRPGLPMRRLVSVARRGPLQPAPAARSEQ